MSKEEKYLELLKNVYLAYLRFDKAINANERDIQEINVAYSWLDANMSLIFDEIGEEFQRDK